MYGGTKVMHGKVNIGFMEVKWIFVYCVKGQRSIVSVVGMVSWENLTQASNFELIESTYQQNPGGTPQRKAGYRVIAGAIAVLLFKV